jgi:hypothetical protein
LYIAFRERQDHVPDHSARKQDKPTQQRIHAERMLARAEAVD